MDRDGEFPGGPSPVDTFRSSMPRPPKVLRRRQTGKDRALRDFAKTMRRAPTDAEAKLWAILRDRRFSNFKFRRQIPLGDYIADFVCFDRRIIVEADGSQHDESRSDNIRDTWLRSQGFRIRRFWNSDILCRPDEVKDTLWAELHGTRDS